MLTEPLIQQLTELSLRGSPQLGDREPLTQGKTTLTRIADTCKASAIVKDLQSSIIDKDELKRSQMLAGLLDFYCSSGQNAQLLRISFWGAFERELTSRLS